MFLRPDLFPHPKILGNALIERIQHYGVDPKTFENFSPELCILFHDYASGRHETLQSFNYVAGIAVQIEMMRQIQTRKLDQDPNFKEKELLDEVTNAIQNEVDQIPDFPFSKVVNTQPTLDV